MRKKGASILEVLVAVIILSAILTGISETMVVLAHQRRATERRTLAMQEAANVMERIGYVDAGLWNEIALSKHTQESLPGAELKIDVDAVAGPPAAKRVALEIVWIDKSGEWNQTVKLVTWKYPPGSAE